MTESRATICIVDDDQPVRTSLSRLLQTFGFDVVAYASPGEFLENCEHEAIGCIVLDLQMPDLNGLELQERLSSHNNEAPIVFLTGHGDVPTSVRAMKRGAVDFLTKPVEEDDLLRAIRVALERDRASRQRRGETAEIRARVDTLTPRELQVLRYVIGGESNKRIASQLGIVEKTVKVHRARVMDKMATRSVAELVRLCERAGITYLPRIL